MRLSLREPSESTWWLLDAQKGADTFVWTYHFGHKGSIVVEEGCSTEGGEGSWLVGPVQSASLILDHWVTTLPERG
jgi:hypothetical protein